MPKTSYHLALITLVGGIALFANLGTSRLWDRDEPRNAGCAMEMLQRGDWVTPVFNDELRTHKPILLYWLMMAAYGCLGISEWTARLPSAVLGLGTALLTYGLGRRLVSPHVGLWAAVILLTTLMFDVASRAATPDSVLIFWTTAAVYLFVWGTFPKPSSGSVPAPMRWFPTWPVAGCMYACMGMAVLAKGPVGLVLPTATIGLYLLIMRRPTATSDADAGRLWPAICSTLRTFAPLHFLRTCWLMRPITALLVASLVALPWYLWVGLRTDGQWLRGFLVDHNLGRATQSLEGHHGSILFYLWALLVGFFPWSVFAVPTVLEIRHQLRQRAGSGAAQVLALCWMVVYIGAFTLASTKLPSYITPCYPAVAILVAVFIDAWVRRKTVVDVRWVWAALICLAMVGLIAVVAVPIAASHFLPGQQWLAVLGLIPIATGVAACYFVQKQGAQRAAVSVAVGALLMTTSIFAVGATQVSQQQQFDTLMTMVKNHSQSPQIGAFDVMEPSWVFYAGRPVEYLYVEDAVPTRQTSRGPANRQPRKIWQSKPRREAWSFLAEDSDHFAIATERFLQRLGSIPDHVQVLGRAKYFLNDDNLVLLAGKRVGTDEGSFTQDIASRRTAGRNDARR